METIIKLNSQVAGKDKIARLLQYACRTAWDSLNSKNDSQIEFIHQLKTLENLLSNFRKCKLIIFLSNFITERLFFSIAIREERRGILWHFKIYSLQQCMDRFHINRYKNIASYFSLHWSHCVACSKWTPQKHWHSQMDTSIKSILAAIAYNEYC